MADTPETGTLLIAPPMLEDPNFRRSVVLLCEHDVEGSMGLILNRPLDMRLGEILDELISSDEPIALGGPVQTNTLHYIHRLGDDIPGSVTISDNLAWGGDFEVVKAMLQRGEIDPNILRFFVGYAGWSPGQLEEELDADGWIVSPSDEALIFSEEPQHLWRDILRRMGGEYALLANFPDNPRLN